MRSSTLSTHSTIFKSIVLLSISLLSVEHDSNFIMTFARLLLLSIRWIFMIFLLSYDWRRHITSIIKRFSMIVLNLAKQSDKNLEFVQNINDNDFFMLRMRLTIDLMIHSTSKSLIIAYNSVVSIFRIDLLHLINNQWIRFAFCSSMTYITYLICEWK